MTDDFTIQHYLYKEIDVGQGRKFWLTVATIRHTDSITCVYCEKDGIKL